MVGFNRLNTPIKLEQYINDTATTAKNTIYENHNGITPLPKTIQTAKGNSSMATSFDTDTYEDRMTIHRYDNDGNVIEISQEDGVHAILIWGYNAMYPIAKIDNATYTSMPESALEVIEAIQSASNTENSSSDEASLRILLDQLRTDSYFESAQISTYTYDPLVGVTSMTDARGYTTYYHYDELNRLETIKDTDGHLISENEYHYKN